MQTSAQADASLSSPGTSSPEPLGPWTVGSLERPPHPGWKLWIGLLGPGIVLAGTSIGSGEWLFGPAVSAQYGGTLLWLASVSIILQVFCNLMMMRYTLYCGEPIIVGGLRTWPGRHAWIGVYLLLDIAAIWPYNASNAAVPLAAAIRGQLPTTPSDLALVKQLGYAIFALSFVPLVFGGTVYRMLERIMTLKLVLVLGYLGTATIFMVSPHNAWEVVTGFVRFGQVPLRAETVVAGPHFSLFDSTNKATLRGSVENGSPVVTEFSAGQGNEKQTLRLGTNVTVDLQKTYQALVNRALTLSAPKRFFVEAKVNDAQITIHGDIDPSGRWQGESWQIATASGIANYAALADVPEPFRKASEQLTANQGNRIESLTTYVSEHGRLPPLDWGILAAFSAIAGAGGLVNTLFSNYCRDKGWGMGARVGAIPSAIGGRTIDLSHVGEVFPLSEQSLTRWRGWLRHVFRDQMIWMLASFVGMALPCMLSLEFIRNAAVDGNRVAAMTADGMAQRFPEYHQFFWSMTLLCGFLVLAPGQVSIGDQIARRWTDIIWMGSRWAKQLAGAQVRYVYYSILAAYAVWGFFALAMFNPLQIAKIGTVLGNVALGVSSLQAWYTNRKLLPMELQPHWFLQLGTAVCGLFFLGLTVIVVATM